MKEETVREVFWQANALVEALKAQGWTNNPRNQREIEPLEDALMALEMETGWEDERAKAFEAAMDVVTEKLGSVGIRLHDPR